MKLSLQNKKMSVEVNSLVVTVSHSTAGTLSVMWVHINSDKSADTYTLQK